MIKIDAEVEIYFYGQLKVATGHVLANLTSVHSNLAVSFGTQQDQEFVAPSVTLNVLTLNLDDAKSDIKIEGFFLSVFTNMILDEFKTKIFAKIGQET